MIKRFVGDATQTQARDERRFRSAVTRGIKAATPAIKGGCKVAFVLAGLLTVIITFAALGVWIWIPHIQN
jgi:hypothetical protein